VAAKLALLMVTNWPWTLFGIMPTNKALMATGLEDADTQSRALIVKWNKLHSVRTLLGGLAILFRFRQQVRTEITIAFAGQVSRAPSFSSDGHARLTNIGSQYLGMFYNTVEMLVESDLPSR